MAKLHFIPGSEAYIRTGDKMYEGGHVFRREVGGLPKGQEASVIQRKDGKWRIMHITDGKIQWLDDAYGTDGEALAEFEKVMYPVPQFYDVAGDAQCDVPQCPNDARYRAEWEHVVKLVCRSHRAQLAGKDWPTASEQVFKQRH
jgi:hypothetical protein